MDVHRTRFIPYPPSAITALAFTHPAAPPGAKSDPKVLRLALGRANGDIEIWNPARGAWVHERTFSGGEGRGVEGLVWTQEPDDADDDNADAVTPAAHGRLRLFSIGCSASVTEWDLASGLPARHSGGNSEVWCLAAQPRWQRPKGKQKQRHDQKKAGAGGSGEFRGQNLVAGCADGTLAVVSTAEGGLAHQRFLHRPSKKRARVLCVAYQGRDVVVAGFADSAVRIYDARGGSLVRTVGLGAGPGAGAGVSGRGAAAKDVLVWAVVCLADGTVVTADSGGEVRFFDAHNYAQTQRVRGHEADALALEASRDGRMVFSGGMDRRTVVYRRGDGGAGGAKGGKWAKLFHRRYHEHDVKAMAVYQGRTLDVLVSGGLDCGPVVLPAKQIGKEYSRALPALPQVPRLVGSPVARLVMSWWDREARVWKYPEAQSQPIDVDPPAPALVAKLVLQGEENVASASISRDGALVALATVAAVKVFSLRPKRVGGVDTVRVEKVAVAARDVGARGGKERNAGLGGARLVQFSPNGKWLAMVASDNEVRLARVFRDDEPGGRARVHPAPLSLPRIERRPAADPLNGAWGSYSRAVARLQFSDDSRQLVAGDLGGNIDAWTLEGDEDAESADTAVRYVAHGGASKDDDSSDEESSSDSGSDSSSDSGSDSSSDSAALSPARRKATFVRGQRWTRNRAARAVPRLDDAPLVLTFRPQQQSPGNSSTSKPNGTTSLATPTRYHLVVLTSAHALLELDLSGGDSPGGLTPWSRRNPPRLLPHRFARLADRAMGCFWDTSHPPTANNTTTTIPIDSAAGAPRPRERLWLYGSNWLFMLDLARDLPRGASEAPPELVEAAVGRGRKRKRGAREEGAPDGGDAAGSGAVEARPDADGDEEMLDDDKDDDDEDGDDESAEDEEDDEDRALVRGSASGAGGPVRDAERLGLGRLIVRGKAISSSAHDEGGGKDEHEDEEGGEAGRTSGKAPGKSHWVTLKYRPILGVVPISEPRGEAVDAAAVGAGGAPGGLEIVLVERPLWDAELGARFEGVHDG